MQLNTSALESPLERLRYRTLIDKGFIHMLWSACHNLASRPPGWSHVMQVISEEVLENMRCAMGGNR